MKTIEKNTTYKVGEVSEQIQANHWAWANNIQYFDTEVEAKEYADKRWAELCNDADEAKSNYVGVCVLVDKCSK
jgi:hypothetical protein